MLASFSWSRRVVVHGALTLAVACVSPAADAQSTRRPVRLRAATVAVGIEFVNVYGGPDKRLITEMGGSGAAWLDYDRDGWVDLFLVNGIEGPANEPVEATAAALADSSQGLHPGGHRLQRNHRGRFTNVASVAVAADRAWGNGVAAADVDNDGFVDLYVTAIGENRLYRNNGDGTFVPWPAGVEDPGWGASAVFTDWDSDGNLDLYLVNYVDVEGSNLKDPEALGPCHYLGGIEVFCGPRGLRGERDILHRNRGDGSFERWPGADVDPEETFGFALLASDCDGDHRPDIYVASDSTINLLYRYDADVVLDDWSFLSGAGLSGGGVAQAGMGVSAADFDGDMDFDLVVSNFQHDHNTLYRNVGGCSFEDVSEPLGLGAATIPYMGWSTLFVDIDGDGDQDIFVANGHIYPQVDRLDAANLGAASSMESPFQPGVDPVELDTYRQRNLLFLNQLAESGTAAFVEWVEPGEVAGEGGVADVERVDRAANGLDLAAVSRSADLADYDNDGDIDLIVTNLNDSPDLLVNDGEMVWPALRLSLVARDGSRDAYGAQVIVEAGDTKQLFELRHSDGYLGSNDPRLSVFLPGGRADRVEIRWPSGSSTVLDAVQIGSGGWLVVDERRGVIARRAVAAQ